MRDSKVQDQQDVGIIVASFYDLQQSKKEADKVFDEEKRRFTKLMDDEFESSRDGSNKRVYTVAYDDEDGTRATGGEYVVTRVQKKSIVWDVDKLMGRVPKGLKVEVFAVNMDCIDPVGLAKYVRSLGGDPKVFKSFFNITYSVNNDEVDRLSEVGEITKEDIEGCYEVVSGKPWYRVTFKAAEGDGE